MADPMMRAVSAYRSDCDSETGVYEWKQRSTVGGVSAEWTDNAGFGKVVMRRGGIIRDLGYGMYLYLEIFYFLEIFATELGQPGGCGVERGPAAGEVDIWMSLMGDDRLSQLSPSVSIIFVSIWEVLQDYLILDAD